MTPAQIVTRVSEQLSALRPLSALSVAFSGGVDSSVLLEAVRRASVQLGVPMPRALYVDHGLEAASTEWAEHCLSVCRASGLSFERLSVDARAGHGQSPEEAARRVRYEALRGVMTPGEVLCVAHHADDQVVTSLLQQLRGAGVLGGGGMPAVRDFGPGRLLRPLLQVRRSDITACARSWGLQWVEDPANDRERHPRNRLRGEVMPLLQDIAPGAVPSLLRAAALQREAAAAVDALAALDLMRCRCLPAAGDAPSPRPAPVAAHDAERDEFVLTGVSRRAIAQLPSARRRAALRRWLREHTRMPSHRRLLEAERQILQAGPDRQPGLCVGEVELRVDGDEVLLFATPPPPIDPDVQRPWNPAEGDLQLCAGRLSATRGRGHGTLRAGDDALRVRSRRGGERCQPQGRTHSQTLKRLLQTPRVPHWQRHGLPLIYRHGELVAVGGLWVCEGHAAAAGSEGWRLCWTPDRRPLSSTISIAAQRSAN